MTRPTFKLGDDEARSLIVRLQSIQELHLLNRRDQRPFVRASLRAV